MAPVVNFENPENKPLELLKLTIRNDGVIKTVPALDSYFVEKRTLSMYYQPPNNFQSSDDNFQLWKSTTESFINDLKWLLSLDFHKFWCNIVYHPSSIDMLVSFLQEAYPPYLNTPDDDSFMNLYNLAYKKVFIIFSRLITNKEAQDKWIDKDYLAKLIYDKFIFTIPIMYDLCLLYGTNNKSHISKLISLVFTIQPKYCDDLLITIPFLQQILQFVSAKFDKSLSATLPESFKGFSNNFGGLQAQKSLNLQKNHLTLDSTKDLVLHILDASFTTKLFIDLYPPARKTFRDKDFHTSIVNFYENTIPKIYEKVHELQNNNNNLVDEIYDYSDILRAELICIYHLIINTTIIDILVDSNIEENVNTYLTIITDGISEKAFMKDYNTAYPVEGDLDIICQVYKDMDPVKCNFILQAVKSHYDDGPESSTSNKFIFDDEYFQTSRESDDKIENQAPSPNNEIPIEAKTQSLISEVKDILPDLGDGYILKCLEHYDFSTERVINSILEGNLDVSLQKLDPKLPIIPVDKLDEEFVRTGIDRINVFDNDEFDIMTRDYIDTSKVHRGKKKYQHKTLSDMLNDKSYVNKMKDTYNKYSILSDDDEYDDTYDHLEHHIVNEASTENEKRRPISMNREYKAESEEESEEGECSNAADNKNSKDEFCVNPEILRARYQAKRDLKYGNKNTAPRDVVGRAKGQGQDKEVLLNRQKKASQKSTRGNHNRRSGAQWKKSTGLVPM